MRIYKFAEYIKESGIGGVNVGGVNFGTDKGNIGSAHFGKKGDSSFNKRGDMNPIDNNLVYSEHTGDYYSQNDIRALMFKYDVWCKQNNEEPLEVANFDTKTLDYILRTIESE
jgi:hypothetical protein